MNWVLVSPLLLTTLYSNRLFKICRHYPKWVLYPISFVHSYLNILMPILVIDIMVLGKRCAWGFELATMWAAKHVYSVSDDVRNWCSNCLIRVAGVEVEVCRR